MPAPTTVRLEFDLDGDVYPELHAALSALRSPQARAERLRQLAAAGLVWEKVRIHGAAAIAMPAVEERPAAAVRADISSRSKADAEPARTVERRSTSPAKRSSRTPAEKRRATDFVDLAINAEPAPLPAGSAESGSSAWSGQHDIGQVLKDLPVLLDVVPDGDTHAHVPAPETPAWGAMGPSPSGDIPPTPSDPAAADSANDEETASLADEAALHVTALAHKPQTKSRLMRMKERGLFKNG